MRNNILYIYSGYLMNYLNTEQIISFADKEISNGASDDYLLSISLSGSNKNAILSELKPIYKEQETLAVYPLYFSLYNKLLRNNEQEYLFLIGELDKLYKNNLIEPYDDKGLFFYRLFDYIGLVSDRLPTNMDMPKDLISFLSPYNEDIQIFKDLGFKVNGFDITLL